MSRFIAVVVLVFQTIPLLAQQTNTVEIIAPSQTFGESRLQHGDRITAVQFSADGKSLFSASADRTIRVHDHTTGKLLRQQTTSLADPLYLQLVGREVVVGFAGGPVTVFDSAGKEVRTIATGLIEGLTISEPLGVMLTIEASGLRCRDLVGDKLRFSREDVVVVVPAPKSGMIFAATDKGELLKLDAKTGKVEQSFGKLLNGAIRSLEINRDETLLALADDQFLLSFDPAKKELPKPRAGSGPLLFTPDSSILISTQSQQTILQEPLTGKVLTKLPVSGSAMALHPEGKLLALGDSSFRIRLFEVPSGKELLPPTGFEQLQGAFFGQGQTLTIITSNNEETASLTTSQKIGSRKAKPADSTKVDLTPAGLRISTTANPLLSGYIPETGRPLTISALPAVPVSLARSPNRSLLALSGRDGLVRLYSPAGNAELWKRRIQKAPLNFVTFSPDGFWLAASAGGRVVVLDTLTGRILQAFHRDFGEGDVQCLAWSSDSQMIAIGYAGAEGTLRIVRPFDGTTPLRLSGHLGAIRSVQFSADQKQLLSTGADALVLIHDLKSFDPLPAPALTAADAWENLDDLDLKRGFQAMRALLRDPKLAVSTIASGYKAAIENRFRMRNLIQNLDDRSFRIREDARKELLKQGLRVWPELLSAAAQNPKAEQQRLLNGLIDEIRDKAPQIPEDKLLGEDLRFLRAIRILSEVGGPIAEEVLTKLADGPKESRLVQDATTALAVIRQK